MEHSKFGKFLLSQPPPPPTSESREELMVKVNDESVPPEQLLSISLFDAKIVSLGNIEVSICNVALQQHLDLFTGAANVCEFTDIESSL